MNNTTPTPVPSTTNAVLGALKRLAAAFGLVAVLGAIAGRAKKRHIIRRFEGSTPTEAREAILAYATRRTGDADKAAHIADRVVERLQQRGVLAPEASGTAA